MHSLTLTHSMMLSVDAEIDSLVEMKLEAEFEIDSTAEMIAEIEALKA